MKNDKLIPGLVLVLIGAAILLNNFGYLHFHLQNIFRLWPIFLVIAGVNLVFVNNRTGWATALKAGVLIIGFGIVCFGNFGDNYRWWPHHSHNYNFNYSDDDNKGDDDNNDNGDDDTTSSKSFNLPYIANTRAVELNISGGGTSYVLNDTTSNLFAANTRDDDNRYTLSSSSNDTSSVVNFKMNNRKHFNFDSDHKQVTLKLSPKPVWSIDIEAGATALDFNLEKFRVKSLEIKGGAASFDIKMGQPEVLTNIEVNTGASGVNIKIPQNAACSIESNSALAGNDFAGFTKTHDNIYETPGFSTAKNRFHIHINGGLSDFNVSRY